MGCPLRQFCFVATGSSAACKNIAARKPAGTASDLRATVTQLLNRGYFASGDRIYPRMIRKLKSGDFRLYSRKKNASTGKRKNLGTFSTLEQAKQHEREVQYFKRH